MATYAIGDVQGCFASLEKLLEAIRFDPGTDQLWFVGDLVNRGPDSVSVLRYVKGLGPAAVVVLGNHDLHLLAVWAGAVPSRHKDTFHDVLQAPDRHDLLEWLRSRPLLHQSDELVLLHAGLLPQWTVEQASGYAAEVERCLQSNGYAAFLQALYEDQSTTHWVDDLEGIARLVVIARVLTRLRICSVTGEMKLSFKQAPREAPPGFLPWFEVPSRKSAQATVIFGHWAALGLYLTPTIMAMDSGCVWGRQLTAVRLEDRRVYQTSCSR
jgi:bis(5'-nucleosyl)-tetraphosphatase (symmetrical)